MKLLMYIYECQSCGSEFKSPQLPGIPYGEFLLRSGNNEISYLHALDDSTFNEVHKMLKLNSKLCNKKDVEIADVLHKIFGYICDKSPTGSYYHIGKQPICPNCGGEKMFSWRPTSPPESINKNVPTLIYSKWSKLTKIEKEEYVNELLSKYLH